VRRVQIAAVVAAAVLVATSTGDLVLLSVLLGLAALDLTAGAVAGLASAAVLARWGTSSLPALAGAQAVLGPAAIAGSGLEAAVSIAAAGALVLAAPLGLAAVPFGLTAAAVVAGPSLTTAGHAGLRAAAAVAAIGVAMLASRLLPAGPRRIGALVAGVGALGLALAA
jgi:hypothetical protein